MRNRHEMGNTVRLGWETLAGSWQNSMHVRGKFSHLQTGSRAPLELQFNKCAKNSGRYLQFTTVSFMCTLSDFGGQDGLYSLEF